MDPFITNGIDPVVLPGLEKRGEDRDPPPRRKRPDAPASTEEETELEVDFDPPKHKLDDLA